VSDPMSPTVKKSTPLVERFAAGGPILVYATAGLSPEHEQARPGPGAWSLAELAAHLVDTDLVFAERMKRVIAEDDPVLVSFEENSWITGLDSHSMSVADAINLLAANRKWMTPILRRCSEADFGRTGQHTERGRMTLAELLAYVTNHLDHHLRFLYAKRATLGIALPPRYGSESLAV
jgi:uncharacterized damage-inducible protein DinB